MTNLVSESTNSSHSGGDDSDVFIIDPSIVARKRDARLVRTSRLLIGFGLVASWQLASGRIISDFWISNPVKIFWALIRLWNDGLLAPAIASTVMEAIVGFAFGTMAGVVIGIIFGVNKLVARSLDPYFVGFYSIPRVALIPLFILWFGIGFQTKVIFTALLVFFPVFMNTLSGVRNVDHDLIDVIRVMGASRLDTIRKIYVPSALVWVFAGLRISVPYALIGAIVAEMFSSNQGLGYLISLTANQFDTAAVFATLGVTTILGLMLDGIVRLIEAHFMRWQPIQH